MRQQSSDPTLTTRVLQGIILGVVLTVPIVLWAYIQVTATPEGQEVVSTPTAKEKGSSKAPPAAAAAAARKATTKQRPVNATRDNTETIPPSQMHLRIDTGARPNQAPQSLETNE
jgi:hypothetical protein